MGSSIEFGVLQDWSETSLIPLSLVSIDEWEFASIKPILDRFGGRNGVEFDLYSSAEIPQHLLDRFIKELETATGTDAGPLAQRLISTAKHAQHLSKPLQYRGL